MRGIITGIAAGLALAATLATAPLAQTGALRELTTGDESRGWDGVGMIRMADGAFCTGALVTDRLVLTAAHCVFDKHDESPLAPGELTFLAGLRDGRPAAHRGIRRVLPHPSFDPGNDLIAEIRHDLALLELDHPIRNGQIGPFGTEARLTPGSEIGVVSYAHDRAEHPSVQEVCQVLSRDDGFLIMSCEADFGSSGAPVFVVEDGRPSVVSVVSAKATVKDRQVSLGADLEDGLATLFALAASGDGVFHRAAPAVRQVSRDDAALTTGAKFVRP